MKISIIIFLGLCCFSFAIEPVKNPNSVEDANKEFNSRKESLIRSWLPGGGVSLNDFPSWESDKGMRINFRLIAAGLEAMKMFPVADSQHPGLHFPFLVESWVSANAKIHKGIGTRTAINEGDFDFYLIQIIHLIYLYKDDPELLSNNAIHALIFFNGKNIPHIGPYPQKMMFEVDPKREGKAWLWEQWWSVIPIVNYAVDAAWNLYDWLLRGTTLLNYPETENHVLMCNIWCYLINQWIHNNYRNDIRIKEYQLQKNLDYQKSVTTNPLKVPFSKPYTDYFQNEETVLEDLLLSAMGRIVQNGYFETNGKPYNAFSLLAIMILYSYVDDTKPGGKKIKIAAQNALDYSAVKYAFQSLEGKQYGPFRRNWKYAKNYGLHDNEYSTFVWGALSGAETHNPDEIGGYQRKGFALLAALSDYRIPSPIHDFILNKDNGKEGYGFWARMQTRFNREHYNLGEYSRYAVNPNTGTNLIGSPNLSDSSIETVPELYFGTRDYIHIAGGIQNRYPPMFGQDNPLADKKDEYSFVSRPTVIIPSGKILWGTKIHEVHETVLSLGTDWNNPYDKTNVGIYKNFSYALTKYESTYTYPLKIFTDGHHKLDTVGIAKIHFYAPNMFPKHYIVLSQSTNEICIEIVPKNKFLDLSEVISKWKNNNADNINTPGEFQYRLLLSNEVLTLKRNYDVESLSDQILKITLQGIDITNEHYMKLSNQSHMDSFPLIHVEQVDERYNFTGIIYADSKGNGIINIHNPRYGKYTINSLNYTCPSTNLLVPPIDFK